MSNLYIFGNGFDKAHLLPCDYWNFREFLEEKDHEFLFNFEKLFGIVQIDKYDIRTPKSAIEQWNNYIESILWKNFEENLGHMDDQEIIGLSDSLVSDLGLDGGPVGILDTMNDYWESYYSFIQKLQQYLFDWVSSIEIEQTAKLYQHKFSNKDCFFTFNYTEVLERIYRIDQLNILHIHGSISNVEKEFAIGHGNKTIIEEYNLYAEESKENFNEGRESIYYTIAELYQKTLKDTNSYILQNKYFFDSIEKIDKIYVFGHSYGEVDLPYFIKIKNSVANNCIWSFYYYSQEDKENLNLYILELGLNKENYHIEHSKHF